MRKIIKYVAKMNLIFAWDPGEEDKASWSPERAASIEDFDFPDSKREKPLTHPMRSSHLLFSDRIHKGDAFTIAKKGSPEFECRLHDANAKALLIDGIGMGRVEILDEGWDGDRMFAKVIRTKGMKRGKKRYFRSFGRYISTLDPATIVTVSKMTATASWWSAKGGEMLGWKYLSSKQYGEEIVVSILDPLTGRPVPGDDRAKGGEIR